MKMYAGNKGELKEVKDDIPTLYVGETSRSIFERSREHWDDWRSRKEESHIRRHQEAEHGGDGAPKFIMRVVKFSKTALSRQIGEAVRIGRRGGAGRILNSKSEYNRWKIPRLVIEEVEAGGGGSYGAPEHNGAAQKTRGGMGEEWVQ